MKYTAHVSKTAIQYTCKKIRVIPCLIANHEAQWHKTFNSQRHKVLIRKKCIYVPGTPWRYTGVVEVYFHSFLTSAIKLGELGEINDKIEVHLLGLQIIICIIIIIIIIISPVPAIIICIQIWNITPLTKSRYNFNGRNGNIY